MCYCDGIVIRMANYRFSVGAPSQTSGAVLAPVFVTVRSSAFSCYPLQPFASSIQRLCCNIFQTRAAKNTLLETPMRQTIFLVQPMPWSRP